MPTGLGIYWSSYDAGNGARLWRKTTPQRLVPRINAAPETPGRSEAA